MSHFDVAVVGGGPSGASTALSLARAGARVVVLEASRFERHRYGETLPPEVTPLLEELGVRDAFEALHPIASPGTVTAWGDPRPSEMDFVRNAHGPGWHVDRARMDRMLCDAASREGASVLLGTRVVGARQHRGGWAVRARRGGSSIHMSARFLVVASGRIDRPIGRLGRRLLEDDAIAVTVRVGHSVRSPDLRTCVESVRRGWWYSAPIPNGETVAMLFTDRDEYRRRGVVLSENLAEAPLTASRLAGAGLVESRVLYAPSQRRTVFGGETWLAVGDAATMFDPLSGLGVFKALRGGIRASDAVSACLQGRDALSPYQDMVAREYAEYARRRRAYYAEESRWPGETFWSRRRASSLAEGTA